MLFFFYGLKKLNIKQRGLTCFDKASANLVGSKMYSQRNGEKC